MKKFFTLLLVSLAAAPLQAADTKPTPATSIIRVNVTSTPYNFSLPWQKRQANNRRGLGALLKDQHILVTAELVQDASYIEFELASTGKKITAQREMIDYEANLAVLKPAEDAGDFFNGMIPLELEDAAKPGDKFEAWQFEENGTPVSTEITFSKAEVSNYFLENSWFLTFEATGTVQYRSGSFTLPVIHDGKLLGMLLTYSAKDQNSEILPFPVIRHVLDDAAAEPYEGFPNFGVKFAPTLDAQLRGYKKLNGHEGGVLVTSVNPATSAGAAGVKAGDVLLEVAGHPIDARGNYQDKDWGLLAMGHLVKGNSKIGDVLPIKILRDGQLMDLSVTLKRKAASEYLVDPYMFDRGPRYVVQGGLLFTELTQTYLEGAGKEWRDRAPFKLVYAIANPEKYEKEGRRKLVFLSGIIPSESTIGYEGLGGLFVTKVNGIDIKDIKDLDTAFTKPLGGLHKIEFDEHPYTIWVDAKQVEDDNQNLLPRRYRITELKRLE